MRIPAAAALCVPCLGVVVTAQAQEDDAQAEETTRDVELDPDEEEARAHFRLAQLQYRRGRFVEAAGAFERAYELSPRPELLYNIYISYRDASEPEPAARALRELLELGGLPASLDRERLEARLTALEREIAERRELEDRLAAQEEQRDQREQRGDAAPRDRGPGDGAPADAETDGGGGTWTPGWVILGAGGVLLAGGAITGAVALGLYDDVTSRCTGTVCPADTESDRSTGQALAITTDILLPLGVVAATTGLVLALTVDGSTEAEDLEVSCGPGGCVVGGRF